MSKQQLKKYGGPILALALLALKVPEILPDDALAIAKIAGGNIGAEEAGGALIDILNEEKEE